MKERKEIKIWADDDWMYCSKKELKKLLIEGIHEFQIFHYTKKGSYEGKPRQVRIIFEEI